MFFSQGNILATAHHLTPKVLQLIKGYFPETCTLSSDVPQVNLQLPNGGDFQNHAELIVHNQKGNLVFVADIDLQACGPQKNFRHHIEAYAAGGVQEYWIIYPKDEILVSRRMVNNTESSVGAFGKADVYHWGDTIESPFVDQFAIKMDLIFG